MARCTRYDTTLCDKVGQLFATDQWFSTGTPVSSTNKPDHHDITEILLKVALNNMILTPERTTYTCIKSGKKHTENILMFKQVYHAKSKSEKNNIDKT
jgi:hypothetical protein